MPLREKADPHRPATFSHGYHNTRVDQDSYAAASKQIEITVVLYFDVHAVLSWPGVNLTV